MAGREGRITGRRGGADAGPIGTGAMGSLSPVGPRKAPSLAFLVPSPPGCAVEVWPVSHSVATAPGRPVYGQTQH